MVKSLREQKREAATLGIVVEPVRRTGEVRFLLPDGGPSVRVNNRRADGTSEVEKLLKKLKKEGKIP